MNFLAKVSARQWVAASAATLALVALAQYSMGRELICKCGVIRLWVGQSIGPENSQQIFDWYSFSHVIHGIFLYAFTYWIGKKRGWSVWQMLFFAVLLEGAWEVIENSSFIIERYRTATLSLDYYGDSILNSFFDSVSMIVGFFLARKLPIPLTVALVLALEFWVGYWIHDNLTLNVIMLVHPVDAIRMWQGAI